MAAIVNLGFSQRHSLPIAYRLRHIEDRLPASANVDPTAKRPLQRRPDIRGSPWVSSSFHDAFAATCSEAIERPERQTSAIKSAVFNLRRVLRSPFFILAEMSLPT